MSHYEDRLEQDLGEIRSRVKEVGQRVDQALKRAVHALVTHQRDQAYEVVLGDLPINRAIRALDDRCHVFVARHLPNAGHLRFVSAVLRLGIAIERVGDYAVTLARQVVVLNEPVPARLVGDIELLAEPSRLMFTQAMEAFVESKPELARGVAEQARALEWTFKKARADLLEFGREEQQEIGDLFALLGTFNVLARVGDQAKNICEETIFAVDGETKQPKVYRVLFLDQRNEASLLAESYARKAFPSSGEYQSAGVAPAAQLAEPWTKMMTEVGLDGRQLTPKSLDLTADELAGLHLIVGLGGDPHDWLETVPFHTVCLQWNVADDPAAALGELRGRIAELMELLRGPEAK